MKKLSEMIVSYLTQGLESEEKSFIQEKTGIKIMKKEDFVFDNNKIMDLVFSKKLHYSWVLDAVKNLKGEDKNMVISSFREVIKEKQEPQAKGQKGINQRFKTILINKYLIPKIEAPVVLKKDSEMLNEKLGLITKVSPDKIEDLIYILGLRDIASVLYTSIDGEKKSKVIENINKKFIGVLKDYLHSSDKIATTSITLDQLVQSIEKKIGIDNIIFSYGTTRVAMAINDCSNNVKNAFFMRAGTEITNSAKKIMKQNTSKKDNNYFVKSLLLGIFYVTGDNSI